jgi:hypothetical protein
MESFGKPSAKFTDAVNLRESPAVSPEEVRREVAIIKNAPLSNLTAIGGQSGCIVTAIAA